LRRFGGAIDVQFFIAPLKNTAHQLIPTNYYSTSWRPLQLCKNPNLKIEEAIGFTGSSINYKAMWQRVNRRKMKEGAAHEKSPPTAIVAAITPPFLIYRRRHPLQRQQSRRLSMGELFVRRGRT